jgi:hypothetical protein
MGSACISIVPACKLKQLQQRMVLFAFAALGCDEFLG